MENSGITLAGAFALAIGIGIQNFPEGAIVSMPIHSEGISKQPFLLVWNALRRCRTGCGAF